LINLKYFVITSIPELVLHRENIACLFQECFSKQIDSAMWGWAYLDNPQGAPIVSLCYTDSGKLVGHYAVIPYCIKNTNRGLKSLLSMTTMVHYSYRKYGLFVKQARDVYSVATQLGYDMVYGFPNKMSAPGFRKRLGWIIHKPDNIITIKGSVMKKNSEYASYVSNEESYTIDNSLLEWRLLKPGVNYTVLGDSLILKEYGGHYDVMMASSGYEGNIDVSAIYNVLIDSSIDIDSYDSKVPYVFGYKLLSKVIGVNDKFDIKKSLILSDIF